MNNGSFLTLSEAIFNPPFPVIVAFLIVLGMWHFADIISKNKLRIEDNLLRISLAYVVVVTITAMLVHALYFSGINGNYIIKIIGYLFEIIGVYYLVKIIRKKYPFCKKFLGYGGSIKIQILFIFITAVPLFLCALGPPTDADSLDYHLGIPLDWYRNNSAYPRYDWMSARLVGMGESINLFGLVNGTDILGQLIQYSGLIVAFAAISSYADSLQQKLLSALLVFTIPLSLFLATVQKPQLFPSAAIVLGILTLLKFRQNYNRRIFLLSMVCTLFAISNKYSFLIPGMIAIALSIVIAKKNNDIQYALLILFILFLCIDFPLYLRNYLFYGDPISPMLESFKSNPSEAVLDFMRLVDRGNADFSFKKLMMFPIDLTFTTNLNYFSTVLGIGILGFFVVYNVSGVSRIILSLSVLIALGFIIARRTLPRYYLESYFLLASSIVSANWSMRHTYLKRGLLLQAAPVALSAIYGAIILFPGALTNGLRENVMVRHAFGYKEAQWMDMHLPKDSVVITNMRSNALIPRKFVVPDNINDNPEKLINIIKKENVTSAMIIYPNDDPVWKILENYMDEKVNEKEVFTRVTRNPLNTGEKYQMWLFTLNTDLNKRIFEVE
ncbi:MAG TPA: DUF1420 family protein [Candidatus Wunengus sp. YC65]|uniref:DUF1420 family protein n=1 Tax=Candidatus Wunengus sp. YC65 TaxID=3367701 RepID=UPI0040257950